MSAGSFPIRCFTCGKPINQFWNRYSSRTDEGGEDAREVLDSLGIGKMCCRRMFTTHVDIEHMQHLYPTHPDNIQYIGILAKNEKPKNFTFKN